MLSRSFAYARDVLSYIDVLCCLDSADETEEVALGYSWGLLDADLRPRPTYLAFRLE